MAIVVGLPAFFDVLDDVFDLLVLEYYAALSRHGGLRAGGAELRGAMVRSPSFWGVRMAPLCTPSIHASNPSSLPPISQAAWPRSRPWLLVLVPCPCLTRSTRTRATSATRSLDLGHFHPAKCTFLQTCGPETRDNAGIVCGGHTIRWFGNILIPVGCCGQTPQPRDACLVLTGCEMLPIAVVYPSDDASFAHCPSQSYCFSKAAVTDGRSNGWPRTLFSISMEVRKRLAVSLPTAHIQARHEAQDEVQAAATCPLDRNR